MTRDERVAEALRSFYELEPAARPDQFRMTRRVLEEAHHMPQDRSPWRRLPWFRHTPHASAIPDTQNVPSPMSATNGRTPTVIWRTQTMFSPSKAIIASAFVFGIGGVLLVAQPFDQGGTVPGAATAPVEPITFTASLRPGNDVGSTTITEVDGRVERRGTVWAPSLAASDPRLEGDVRLSSPQDQYPGPAGPQSFVFGTTTWRIENEEGAWQGTNIGFTITGDGVEAGSGGTVVLAGEGAYEGLYAALDVSDPYAMRGVIFPAPPPDAPTSPSA